MSMHRLTEPVVFSRSHWTLKRNSPRFELILELLLQGGLCCFCQGVHAPGKILKAYCSPRRPNLPLAIASQNLPRSPTFSSIILRNPAFKTVYRSPP